MFLCRRSVAPGPGHRLWNEASCSAGPRWMTRRCWWGSGRWSCSPPGWWYCLGNSWAYTWYSGCSPLHQIDKKSTTTSSWGLEKEKDAWKQQRNSAQLDPHHAPLTIPYDVERSFSIKDCVIVKKKKKKSHPKQLSEKQKEERKTGLESLDICRAHAFFPVHEKQRSANQCRRNNELLYPCTRVLATCVHWKRAGELIMTTKLLLLHPGPVYSLLCVRFNR